MTARKNGQPRMLRERATVIDQEDHPEAQHILRLHAPNIARDAHPGQFIHIQCDPLLPLRRPMSILRADPDKGNLEILYAVHGEGTQRLAQKQAGETLDILGAAGNPFKRKGYRERPLLLGGGVGIPPLIFLAERMAQHPNKALALLGSERPFPLKTSELGTRPHLPREASRAAQCLQQKGIPSALASASGQAGCYRGYVTALARHWLNHILPAERAQVEIFACGPKPMLEETAKLAREYDLPCEVCLEEYMACATGGCGACVVAVTEKGKTSMQRVCVEGPVFKAQAIFPPSEAP